MIQTPQRSNNTITRAETFDIKFEGSNAAGVLVSNNIRVIVDDGLGLPPETQH